MQLLALLLPALLVLAGAKTAPPTPKLWALLVAGSNGYYNYRHQADVCHAYQILHRHGIPDENIVVMMYDDIANSTEYTHVQSIVGNPTKGVVINHPFGKDVYKGVPHDYTGDTVTPDNFLKILQGDAAAMKGIGSGKVIASGPDDHVFVNFVDHGAPGIVAFPDSELTAKEWMGAITSMHEKKQYKEMVIYVEACESGSMFKGLLPKNINVFATTAANASESSYACYYDNERQTYLGDWYSVHWMEDSDKENIRMETLIQQYKKTMQETNTSHVEVFGDPAMGRLPVAEFQGEGKAEPISYHKPAYTKSPDCYDVPLAILMNRHSYAQNVLERQAHHDALQSLMSKRDYLQKIIKLLADHLSSDAEQSTKDLMTKKETQVDDWDRYTELVHSFSTHCFNLGKNPYALKYVYVVLNLSNSKAPTSIIKSTFEQVCGGVDTNVPGGVH